MTPPAEVKQPARLTDTRNADVQSPTAFVVTIEMSIVPPLFNHGDVLMAPFDADDNTEMKMPGWGAFPSSVAHYQPPINAPYVSLNSSHGACHVLFMLPETVYQC